ncbi:phosphate ABC transporter, permease protein PstA, partial [Flavobacterium psychrophilum]|nr:phosphate ABC transporter, permease protein PstA [Flavobacterium psychrophilum]
MSTTTTEEKSLFFSRNTKSSDLKGRLIIGATLAAVILIIAVLFLIIGIIVYNGSDMFSWEFISSFPTDGMTKGGILPAIIGTFILVIVMSLAAVPFGTITALYLTEYAAENS